jgi:putative DNA primase/helicase
VSTTDPLGRVLETLDGARKNGTGWVARCPGHEDRNPSLSIHVGDDGRVLLRCFAGCSAERIVAALGLTMRDLFPPRDAENRANGRADGARRAREQSEATTGQRASEERPKRAVGRQRWQILDAAGRVVAAHVRTNFDDGSKNLSWERPDGRPGLGGISSKDLPLYGIHERLPGQTTVVFEGEPARDAAAPLLAGLGIAAVATVTGASAIPNDDVLRPLLDGRVLLWPDSDAAGESHMDLIHWRLRELGQPQESIGRITWDGAQPGAGDDAADFVAAGGTAAGVGRLLADTRPWSVDAEAPGSDGPRTEAPARRLVIRALSDVEPQPIDWLWLRWLARGKFHVFAGHPGDGKSTLAAWLAAVGSTGGAWPDGSSAPKFRTLFVLGEDSLADTLRPRLDLFGADASRIHAIEMVLDEQGRERFFDVAKHLDLLEEAVAEHGIDLLVIDPISTSMAGSDRNAEGDTRDRLTPLVKLAERRNLAVLGIGHVGKPNGTARTPLQRILGSTGLGALARIVWMTATAEDGMAVGPIKSNLAVLPDAMLWTRPEDGPIVWHGSACKPLGDLLDAAMPRTPRADAEGFLRDYLAGGSKPSTQVHDAAKANGISGITLRRASEALAIKKWKAPGPNGPWYWRLPDRQPVHPDPRTDTADGNLLTPIEIEVSKLSKFHPDNLITGNGGEHLRATAPIFGNGRANGAHPVMEGAQLAHPAPLRGEQVPSGSNGTAADRTGHAREEGLF